MVSDTPWQDYLWRARVSGERPSLAEVLRAALSGETEQVGAPVVVSGSRVTPEVFDEAMKVTDAEFHDHGCKGWIVMRPRSYYDVRKFGRDVLDVETCAPRPLTGATLWGYPILTTKDAEPGVAWLVGRRRDGSWARLKMVLNAQEYGSWNPIDKVLNQGAAAYWSWHDDGNEVVAQVMCGTLREWLATLVALEGPYVRCDDPRARLFGMRKVEGGRGSWSRWCGCSTGPRGGSGCRGVSRNSSGRRKVGRSWPG